MSASVSTLILDPPMAASTLVAVGYKKSHLPPWKMFVLAFMAGLYVGFGNQSMYAIFAAGGADGAVTSSNSTLYDPASGVLKFFAGAVFATVLACITICGAELFTGNCLILMAVLNGKVTLKEMLFDWLIVYFGNFAGGIFFAVIIYAGGVNGYSYSITPDDFDNYDKRLTRAGYQCCAAAAKKAEMKTHEMFFSAIPANFMVCLAVIMACASKTATDKIFSCILPVGIFLLCGWSHCIANMNLFAMATLLNCNDGHHHGKYWLHLLLSTLGNIVGASILAVGYWVTYLVDSPNQDLHHPHLSSKPTDVEAARTEPVAVAR